MMYYSFYKDGKYVSAGTPEIELKGLDPKKHYRIEDYVNDKVILEDVTGDKVVFSQKFDNYLLVRAVEIEDTSVPVNPFVDVTEGKYYYDAVLWAAEKNITKGYPDGSFQPDREVTRAEFVTFQYRANGTPNVETTENPFIDVSATAHKNFMKAILWAVENKITLGKDAEHFLPNVICSRGDVVTFLYRYECSK